MMYVTEGCKEEEEYESQYVFVQSDPKYSHIPSTWLLLDSCSTVSVMKSRDYVKNIRKGTRALVALTNGGQQKSKDVAGTQHFGQVWFNEKSMANILTLADVVKYARVTMDSAARKSMFVHRHDGVIMEFKKYKSGLYYFDLAEECEESNTISKYNYDYLPSFSLLHTVDGNKSKYTKREVRDAE
jgi:hypothetical protein